MTEDVATVGHYAEKMIEELRNMTPEQLAAREREWLEREQAEKDRIVADRLRRLVPERFRSAEITDERVREWWQNREPRGLLLSGPTGTGKTHNAYAIANECIRTTEYNPIVRSVPMLLAELSPSRDHVQLVNTYSYCPLLILDDLGVERNTPYAAEQVHLMIDNRYAVNQATVITTNVAPRDFSKTFGERLASRLSEMCRVIVFRGPDRRRGRPA